MRTPESEVEFDEDDQTPSPFYQASHSETSSPHFEDTYDTEAGDEE